MNKKLEIYSFEKNSEGKKIKAMVGYIFKNEPKIDAKAFIKFILQPNEGAIPLTKNSVIHSLESITPDANIKTKEVAAFQKEMGKLLESEELLIGKLKGDILPFIYNVRNNIFHGTKNTIEMTEKNQRDRLNIYSRILIATNDLLFNTLGKDLKFTLPSGYKLRI